VEAAFFQGIVQGGMNKGEWRDDVSPFHLSILLFVCEIVFDLYRNNPEFSLYPDFLIS